MAEAEAKAQGAAGQEAERELVRYEAGDGIAVLTLDDPPANTYTYEMMQQLDRAVLRARMDEGVHVVVITGGGEKFFSAGANIKMLSEVTPTFKYFFCLHANETLSRLEQTPKLVIAAVGGHCVGGGLEIALAADLRVARKGAGKMGLPEVTLGVLPGTGGTQRLTRMVGKSRAIELMATGELFDFERALELGLVNRLFEADTAASFLEQALAYARQFAAPEKAARKRSEEHTSELQSRENLVCRLLLEKKKKKKSKLKHTKKKHTQKRQYNQINNKQSNIPECNSPTHTVP